jgi:hypothetical protein
VTHSDDPDPTTEILQREVEPEEDEANYRVLETIAEVEDVDVTELPPMYSRIDHILDQLFSDPPTPEAQVEITFSYYGYRVTIDQEGVIRLRKLDGDLADHIGE